MAALTETQVLTEVKTQLKETGTDYWSANELSGVKREVLREVSRRSPYKTRDTTHVVTVANSLELDISSLDSLADLIEIYNVEYEAGENPQEFRNWDWVDETTIRMDMTSEPSASSEAVYVYYGIVHTLSTSSTLTPQLEEAVIQGIKAKAMMQYCQNARVWLKSAKTEYDLGNTEVAQAIADLDSGRGSINALPLGMNPEIVYANYARTGLSNARGYQSTGNQYVDLSKSLKIYEELAKIELALYEKKLREIPEFRMVQRDWPKD